MTDKRGRLDHFAAWALLAGGALTAGSSAAVAEEVVKPTSAFALSMAVQSQELRERTASGQTLVREAGVVPRLGAEWLLASPDLGQWTAGLEAWGGELAYEGRSQTGVPLASRTESHALLMGLRWSGGLAPGWTLDAGAEMERFARRIRGVGLVGGLDERTTQARLVIGLGLERSPWAGYARWAAGPRAPLSVRFDAGSFDDVRLASGGTRAWRVGISRQLTETWSLRVDVERLQVGASQAALLLRGGAPVGLVTQPEWVRYQAGLTIERNWR